jgi:glycosyltransferase involved in cell wall biosynthesis
MIETGKKILIGCYEVPGYGSENTASHKLFQMMHSRGLDASYLNIIDEQYDGYFKYVFGENYANPYGLDNVYNCAVNKPLNSEQTKLTDLVDKIAPDIMVGIGYPAAFLLKKSCPQKPLIFLTSGCAQADQLIASKEARDAISLTETINQTCTTPLFQDKLEKKTVEISDLIITHSDLIKNLFLYFYHPHSGKIYSDIVWSGDWIHKDALDYSELKKPFTQREIDVIFVASSWARPEKNFNLVKKIVSCLEGLNIHIVGEVEKKLPNAKHHGLIRRREDLFALLGNTKTVVCPSLFDPAPGILFEASAFECNIITSKNCGNWKICNEKLLIDPFNLINFIERISISLKNKFEDNMGFFIKTNSFDNLMDVISVF